ncbi:MAG: acylphosphatase [Candidatus Omnitrophica bacterium]|nr:acylphosphatase [Candidatus Omnitrophota bacterium]
MGFRFTAERIALDLGIVGWVRNLPDGRVEILCESRKDKIEEFMKRVGQSLTPYIHKVHCSWEEARGEFDDFRIEFCV